MIHETPFNKIAIYILVDFHDGKRTKNVLRMEDVAAV